MHEKSIYDRISEHGWRSAYNWVFLGRVVGLFGLLVDELDGDSRGNGHTRPTLRVAEESGELLPVFRAPPDHTELDVRNES